MELLVVLSLLAAVGGIVLMTVSDGMTVVDGSGRRVTPEVVATQATLREVEKALVGSVGEAGYHTHNLEFPSRIAGLFFDVDSVGPFDLSSKRGWNGPYLFDSGARYREVTEPGDADNFTAAFGADTDPAILDGWGKPIILQQPDTLNARLVSAGPNRVLETDPSDPIDADRGDDQVLFLRASDPNL